MGGVSRRVLVVEDEAQVRGLFHTILTNAGYEVREAGNGREALALLDTGYRPDVILLDLVMPVMNGWQLRAAQRERADIRDIPVILISGSSPRVQPIEAKALQAAASLRKPVRAEVLLATIAGVLTTNGVGSQA